MGSTTLERPRIDHEADSDTSVDYQEQPPYAVVLHNDDVNGFEYVVKVLRKVLGYGLAKALRLTLEAHMTGHSVVWSGALEIAELRAEQIVSCGPDPAMVHRGARPLRVSVEPLQ